MTEQTPIKLEEIRKGDHIRKEYDADTPIHATAIEYVAKRGEETSGPWAGQHFLLDRPVPPTQLPLGPGYFFDCDGDPIRLKAGESARAYAPYTRLHTAPEIIEQFGREVLAEFDGIDRAYVANVRDVAARYGVTL